MALCEDRNRKPAYIIGKVMPEIKMFLLSECCERLKMFEGFIPRVKGEVQFDPIAQHFVPHKKATTVVGYGFNSNEINQKYLVALVGDSDTKKIWSGSRDMTKLEADKMLIELVHGIYKPAVDKKLIAEIDDVEHLPAQVFYVLIDLSYNMGLGWYLKFPNVWKMLMPYLMLLKDLRPKDKSDVAVARNYLDRALAELEYVDGRNPTKRSSYFLSCPARATANIKTLRDTFTFF